MPGSANQDEPNAGQDLDLTKEEPSPASHQVPLDRIPLDRISMMFDVAGNGLEGRADLRVKGDLQGTAEYLVVCGCGVLVAIAVAVVCWIGGIEGLTLLGASLATAITSSGAGIWYLSRRLPTRNIDTRRTR